MLQVGVSRPGTTLALYPLSFCPRTLLHPPFLTVIQAGHKASLGGGVAGGSSEGQTGSLAIKVQALYHHHHHR